VKLDGEVLECVESPVLIDTSIATVAVPANAVEALQPTIPKTDHQMCCDTFDTYAVVEGVTIR